MNEFKSIYQQLMEELEGNITVLTPDDNYELISSLNKEMATFNYEVKLKESEAELEIAQIYLNT